MLRRFQDDLETVVPKVGKRVRMLNRLGGSKKARVVFWDAYRHVAMLELEGGSFLESVDYEDFSKIA